MTTILNLTQHLATLEQIDAGVVDLPPDVRAQAVDLLTFDNLPTRTEVRTRAADLAALVMRQEYWGRVMIGGAPFLMAALETALTNAGLRPCYAFSRRESVETVQTDGSVRKVAVFRHAGFV